MKRATLAVALLGLSLWPMASNAVLIDQMSMDVLMDSSALVFKGVVQSINTNAGVNLEPRTTVAFNVEAVYLGATTYGTTFTHAGGIIPASGYFMHVPGMPTFEVGQRYIVFIRNNSFSLTPVTNWELSVLEQISINNTAYAIFLDGACVAEVNQDGFQRGGLIANPVRTFKYGPASQDVARLERPNPPAPEELAAELPNCMTWQDVITSVEGWVVATGNANVNRPYSVTPTGPVMEDYTVAPQSITAGDTAESNEEFEGSDGAPP